MSKIIPPEFILIPYELIDNENISPLDERLYGIIYWFTQLKREKCIASNSILAKLVKTTVGAIQNSLTNLENNGYIKRIFKDVNRRCRLEIIPLIVLTKVSPTGDRVSPTGDSQVSPTGEENKSNINKSNKNKKNEQSSNISLTKKRQEITSNIIKDFINQVEKDFSFKPDTDKSDFIRIYTLTGKYKEKELREIMNYYFDSEKYDNKKFAKRPRIAFSVDTINKYKQNA